MIDETQLREREILVERSVAIPMRDGVRLYADIWRPDTDTPLPVLVMRTPYNRKLMELMGGGRSLARDGYVVISQDCRGRFESEGEGWAPIEPEADDAYDTIEWAAAQPWSNGKVATFGASYMGHTQWQAAIARPPSLVAMLPECCASDHWEPIWGPGGAFKIANRMSWALSVAMEEARRQGLDDPLIDEANAAIAAAGDDILARSAAMAPIVQRIIEARPLRDIAFFGKAAPWFARYFDRDRRDDPSWSRISPRAHFANLDLPAIHVGGWFDIHSWGTIDAFVGMTKGAKTARGRDNQFLIMGPWAHWGIVSGVVGDVDFGPEATLDIDNLRKEWFGHWLHNRDTGVVDRPKVRIFVMGENAWRDEHEWPLARTQWTSWHLHDGGRLASEAPRGSAPDAFTFDPRDPAPTVGGNLLGENAGARQGPVEQGDLASRADVLAYTSDELTEPLEITGPVRAEIWASTSAPDTDFTAKLVDVHPDGRSYNILEGIVRARSVTSIPLEPGAAYCFPITMGSTSIVLPAGHRVRVLVSSSSWPMWEPNANTGNAPGSDTYDDLRTADQRVFHDPTHPSRVILPVIPR
jgi:putative CocE/NonD family hydrolase